MSPLTRTVDLGNGTVGPKPIGRGIVITTPISAANEGRLELDHDELLELRALIDEELEG